ncbi:conserved hypothetical protein [Candidatus Sulfopaludibacter sp. SbA4]|nr:conserved hypothetical protein [Candidatus Sulfopaludibacter sp. SbA4]
MHGALLPPELVELLQLGQILGQNQSFAIVAGRCSAAQAETILRIREGRLYLRCASSWKAFCPEYLHISGTQADRIIRMWQQHGPAIFELRQLIRITPEDFRAVEPFIKENALHFNDEAIELDPQNSQKIADAVDDLCRNMPPKEKPAPTTLECLAALDKQCQAIVSEFQRIANLKCHGEARARLELTLNFASAALQQIEMEHGLYPQEPRA